jgi:predicted DNA-binding protein
MNKDVTCTFRLDKTIHDKLDKLLKEKGVKRSDYIREAILKKMYDEVLLGLD